ncbi:MAG TPA: hypothetical protein DHU96_27695 [Actinobacteria bacterium]|nr:hypothetical protein [Actinomycetota bacterium]
MTDHDLTGLPKDPTTAQFWRAAREHRLIVQRCRTCGAHQFYPRPFCLSCFGLDLEWVQVSGHATVYSKTTVRIPVIDEMPPPYVVAIVTLDEGPRLTTNLVGDEPAIGERVSVTWRERADLPPLPVFQRLAGDGDGDKQSASQMGAG